MPPQTEVQPTPVRLVLLTQDDVFFLPEALDYFLRRLAPNQVVAGCVLFDVSPFGKKESFLQKALKTLRIFGPGFFWRNSLVYVLARMRKRNVRTTMETHGIPVVTLQDSVNAKSSLENIRSLEPDVLISVAGNQIFKKELIGLPRLGTLNLHTALLPKYRGLMPSFWVLLKGEPETGVSVFLVDEGIDTGPILVQKRLRISGLSQWSLIKATKVLGMEAILEAVRLLQNGSYETIPNDAREGSYYTFPKREDVLEFLANGNRFY